MESYGSEKSNSQQYGGPKLTSLLTHVFLPPRPPRPPHNSYQWSRSRTASNEDISNAMVRHVSECEYACPAGIDKLPEEIVCQIMELVIDIDDHDSLKHLAALVTCSPRTYEIFRGYRHCVMRHLLQNRARELALCFAKAPKELSEVQTQNRWWFLTRLVFSVQRYIYRRHDDYVQGNKTTRCTIPADAFSPASQKFIHDFLTLEIFNLFGRDAPGTHGDNSKLWESLPIHNYLSVLRFIRRRIYYYGNGLKTDGQLQRRLKVGLLPVYNYRCFVVMHALRGLHSGYLPSAENNVKDIEDFVSDTGIWEMSGPSFDSNAWTLIFLGWGHA